MKRPESFEKHEDYIRYLDARQNKVSFAIFLSLGFLSLLFTYLIFGGL